MKRNLARDVPIGVIAETEFAEQPDTLVALWLERQQLLSQYERVSAAERDAVGWRIGAVEQQITGAPATTAAGLMVQALLLSQQISIEDAEWCRELAVTISTGAGRLAAGD